ncbi:MAG: hypothetical protein Q9M94_02285 [Candidatus Gracilibacteria bacterium]|nr:hypothetical protein [Candidatus Gracilibacteria bacterium]MDQ7023808.1 hypothetical protein [Candidatus Gracilibacteria bacterium]
MELIRLELGTKKAKDLGFQAILNTLNDIFKLSTDLELDKKLKKEIELIQKSLDTIVKKRSRM